MFISYKYQENVYHLLANWTSAEGQSIVFRDVMKRIAERHHINIGDHLELAEHLDTLTDKLYKQIHDFIDEYEAVPFDPRFRRIIMKSLAEIIACVNDIQKPEQEDGDRLLACLFMEVADKLRDLVSVYLEERAYQSKFRDRLRHKEQYIETTHQHQLSFEFESVLLQMTDLSRLMECLTDKQRQRLVKHVFLKYTMQEIATQESVSHVMVAKSIAAALKKIKVQMS